MGKYSSCLSLAVALMWCIAAAGYQADDQQLLDRVVANHRAAVESIRTLTCKFTIEQGSDTLKPVLEGEYWRSPDAVRLSERYPAGVKQETRIRDGEALSRSIHADPDPDGNTIFATRKVASDWSSVGD